MIQQMPKFNKKAFRIIKVASSSMSPLLKVGEKVLLKKTKHFRQGDLVGFYTESRRGISLIHRIVKVTKDGLVTSGDKSTKFDGLVNLKYVYGKAYMVKIDNKWKKIKFKGTNYVLSYLLSFLIRLSVRYPSLKCFYKLREFISGLLRNSIESV